MMTRNCKINFLLMPTVFVIDDDKEIRDAMRWLLESVRLNVACFEDAKSFLQIHDNNAKGCIVADVRMPFMSGLELLEELNRRKNSIPIIMITGHGDVQMAVRAMKAGAIDFILKPFNDQQLLEQIQKAIELSVAQIKTESQVNYAKRIMLLTSREREVLELITSGKLNKQIAVELNIAVSTVELHRSNIMRKLEVRTLADLMRSYMCTMCEK